MNDTIIELQGLHKAFGRRPVLCGVDLSIPRGAVVGLLGTNGSGKSTLVKCLLGLLRIDTGTATIFGDDSWNLTAETKARLGYVPQEIQLYPWMRVKHVIAYTAAFYPTWDHSWTTELTRRWQLAVDDRVGPLSTGQKQKLALILALGHRPDVLILDEPVASLDPIARREFLKSLVEITGDACHTVLFSTHITSDLERVASHVALLRDGKISHFDELDVLKERMKRVRISARQDLPETFAVDGALRTEVHGHDALVALADVNPQLLDELRTRWQADVAVEDLNLEEIFLEMHDA